jgi:hypothetical protein
MVVSLVGWLVDEKVVEKAELMVTFSADNWVA